MGSPSDKVLITGITGFTGTRLKELLVESGYDVFGISSLGDTGENHIKCDITDKEALLSAIKTIKPDYVVHLAGISFVAHDDISEIYNVNLFGTVNLIDSLTESGIAPKKVVIASSANVYGNPDVEIITEDVCPLPINHYSVSKLAMECIVRTYFDKLDIIIARPFNYTGPNQAGHFLIPKIVNHFKDKKEVIELGNLDIIRDFSDIRYVVKVYKSLMECDASSQIVNICSGTGSSLNKIIHIMNELAGYAIEVKINPEFVRENEISTLIGSNEKLFKMIGGIEPYPINETLRYMYQS